MGSPLSSLLAEIFMNQSQLLCFQQINVNPSYSHVGYWFQYVDDFLCLLHGSGDLIHHFLTFINPLYPNINLSVEFKGTKINFLHIIISMTNNRHNFKLSYNKSPRLLISQFRNSHPPSHKHTVFHSISVRISPANFLEKVNIIST